MHNSLTAVFTAVVYNTVSVVKTFCLGNLCNCLKALCYIVGIICIDCACAADVLLGHYKNMNRSLRIDVSESENILVLIHLCRGNVPCYDFTKQAYQTTVDDTRHFYNESAKEIEKKHNSIERYKELIRTGQLQPFKKK